MQTPVGGADKRLQQSSRAIHVLAALTRLLPLAREPIMADEAVVERLQEVRGVGLILRGIVRGVKLMVDDELTQTRLRLLKLVVRRVFCKQCSKPCV